MTRQSSLATLVAIAAVFSAAPATARKGLMTVIGTITSGSDTGNDLVSTEYVGGQLVATFAPGNFFGTSGSLAGKQVAFSFLYDTAAPTLPIVAGGVFDDQSGEWATSLGPVVTVGGVARTLLQPPTGTAIYYLATATLGLVDGTPDGISGNFTSGTYVSTLIDHVSSSAFAFTAVLPTSFLSTDALLPGAVPAPRYGFAHSAATGSGTFTFIEQSCLFSCSLKTASAVFGVTSVTVGPVPEPAMWAMMLVGFGIAGAVSRRRRTALVVIA
nr:PEPxxWA-CTERM sorting domain-containing protein [Polymorphobacter sp.]